MPVRGGETLGRDFHAYLDCIWCRITSGNRICRKICDQADEGKNRLYPAFLLHYLLCHPS